LPGGFTFLNGPEGLREHIIYFVSFTSIEIPIFINIEMSKKERRMIRGKEKTAFFSFFLHFLIDK
jgi:hypothetical protein